MITYIPGDALLLQNAEYHRARPHVAKPSVRSGPIGFSPGWAVSMPWHPRFLSLGNYRKVLTATFLLIWGLPYRYSVLPRCWQGSLKRACNFVASWGNGCGDDGIGVSGSFSGGALPTIKRWWRASWGLSEALGLKLLGWVGENTSSGSVPYYGLWFCHGLHRKL